MLGKVIKVTLVVLILILGIVQIVPESADAQGRLSIQIIFDEGPNEADVRPGSDGKIIILGRVLSDEPARDVRVELAASVDQGWPCTVDPVEIIVPPRSEAPFSIEITATIGASYYTTGTLSVGGTVGYYPGSLVYTITPITGTLIVRQYSKFSISSSKPLIKTQPGAKETFEVEILNEGNAGEIYNIEIINFDKLDLDGFTATLSLREIEVAEKEDATFQLKVTVPSGMDALGTHKIEIQVTPKNLEVDDAQAQNYTLIVRVTEEKIIFTYEFQIIIVIIFISIVASILFIKWRRKKNKSKYSNINKP